MNPFEMVVLIVAIVTIGGIIRAKHGHRHARRGHPLPAEDPDTLRLREEVEALKDRVAVLERLATDNTSALDREIELLRSRDKA